jgi:hypothetical protein
MEGLLSKFSKERVHGEILTHRMFSPLGLGPREHLEAGSDLGHFCVPPWPATQ